MSVTKKIFVYIGNWRAKNKDQNGFGIFQYNEDTGQLTYLNHAINDICVGAAYVDSKRNILYCGNEQTNLPGRIGGGGQIAAIRLDPQSGEMTEISRTPSYGVNPTYIAVDSTRRYMVVTHHSDYIPVTKIGKDPYGKYNIYTDFGDTTTVLFRLNEDGTIGEPCDVWHHLGHGKYMDTQSNPHVHSVKKSPEGDLFALCDKGSDRIYFFRIDYEAGRLVILSDTQSVAGSSPRHSCFHPTLPYWFMNNESKTIVRSFRYNKDGAIEPICTVDILPDGFKDDPSIEINHRPRQSDITIHPSGKYIYTLIRGISYVTVLEVDQNTGALKVIQSVELDGAGPRTCAVSPDGRFLLTSLTLSGKVVTWNINSDGTINPANISASQPSPGIVSFYQPS